MDTSKSASFCAWLGNLSGFSVSTLHFMTEALLLARKLVLKYDQGEKLVTFSFLKICISVFFPILKILAYPFAFISDSAVLCVFLTLGDVQTCICWPIANLSVGQNRSIGRAGCWISGEWQSIGKRVKLRADMLKKSHLCSKIWVNSYPSNKCHKFSSII